MENNAIEKGKNYFLTLCEKEGIPCEWFCTSNAREGTVFDKVYKYPAGESWKPYHKYAIKYFPQDDLFICWNAQIKKRKYYRLLKKEADFRLERNQLIAKKGIEFAWRAQEDVYVFKTIDVQKFIDFLKQ